MSVNRRTRIRDQERSRIAADIKKLLREKSTMSERTFALTADVSEVHRQVPIDPLDWPCPGAQVSPGDVVQYQHSGHVRDRVSLLLLVPGRHSLGPTLPVNCGSCSAYILWNGDVATPNRAALWISRTIIHRPLHRRVSSIRPSTTHKGP